MKRSTFVVAAILCFPFMSRAEYSRDDYPARLNEDLSTNRLDRPVPGYKGLSVEIGHELIENIVGVSYYNGTVPLTLHSIDGTTIQVYRPSTLVSVRTAGNIAFEHYAVSDTKQVLRAVGQAFMLDGVVYAPPHVRLHHEQAGYTFKPPFQAQPKPQRRLASQRIANDPTPEPVDSAANDPFLEMMNHARFAPEVQKAFSEQAQDAPQADDNEALAQRISSFENRLFPGAAESSDPAVAQVRRRLKQAAQLIKKHAAKPTQTANGWSFSADGVNVVATQGTELVALGRDGRRQRLAKKDLPEPTVRVDEDNEQQIQKPAVDVEGALTITISDKRGTLTVTDGVVHSASFTTPTGVTTVEFDHRHLPTIGGRISAAMLTVTRKGNTKRYWSTGAGFESIASEPSEFKAADQKLADDFHRVLARYVQKGVTPGKPLAAKVRKPPMAGKQGGRKVGPSRTSGKRGPRGGT